VAIADAPSQRQPVQPFVGQLGDETDAAAWRMSWFHEFADCREDRRDDLVMLSQLLSRRDSSCSKRRASSRLVLSTSRSLARLRVNPRPANAYQLPAGCKPQIELAGIRQRWLEVERAMGIEPTGKALPSLRNKRIIAMADAKCD